MDIGFTMSQCTVGSESLLWVDIGARPPQDPIGSRGRSWCCRGACPPLSKAGLSFHLALHPCKALGCRRKGKRTGKKRGGAMLQKTLAFSPPRGAHRTILRGIHHSIPTGRSGFQLHTPQFALIFAPEPLPCFL